jgi:hypothetical protein
MLTSPEVTGATDPRHSLGDIKMKPANHFRVELPEVLSELPVKFPRIERVY